LYYVDRTRSRVDTANLHINHGGFALFYRNDLRSRHIVQDSLCEVVGAFFHCPIVIYRPGSAVASDDFFEDLSELLKLLLIIGKVK